MYRLGKETLYPQDVVSLIRKNKKIGIFFRHSERFTDNKVLTGNEVQLTEKGISMAKHLGESFSQVSDIKCLSSPIHRCISTLESVNLGSNKIIPIKKSKLLGDPGIFFDPNSEINCWYEMERQGFINYSMKYFDTGSNIGSRPLELASKELLEFFLINMVGDLTLFNSHDFLVGAFMKHLGVKNPTPNDFVDFLEGVVIEQSDKEITFHNFKQSRI